MAKNQLVVKNNVRTSTKTFIESIQALGARVAYLVRDYMSQLDCAVVKGRGKFNARMFFDYERNIITVFIFTGRGVQTVATIKSASEMRALFSTWNIVSY